MTRVVYLDLQEDGSVKIRKSNVAIDPRAKLKCGGGSYGDAVKGTTLWGVLPNLGLEGFFSNFTEVRIWAETWHFSRRGNRMNELFIKNRTGDWNYPSGNMILIGRR